MSAVMLTRMEAAMALHVGVMRHMTSVFRGRQDRHGAALSWDLHLEGACGELAYCKHAGIFWDGSIDVFKRPDIGGSIQIRTRSRHDYELIVRDDDADTDWFVLITGRMPRFEIRGCLRGADAKRAEWRQTHGDREAAFFVPTKELLGVERLLRVEGVTT